MKRRFSLIPRAFLFVIPLHLGVELITAIGLLNKASGFYGILSIFTGHPLSVMEWILNLLSLATLPLYIMSFQSIQTRNALHMVLFAYLYTLDSLCSIGFSIYFCVHWFTEKAKAMASSSATDPSAPSTPTPAGAFSTSTMLPTATNEVLRRLAAEAETESKETGNSINKSASLPQETATTIVITVAFLLIRIYFTLIVIAYARQLVRQQNLRPNNNSSRNSFKAKLQYVALSLGQSFWTGRTWANSRSLTSSSSSSSISSSASTTRRAGVDEATTRLYADFDDVDDHEIDNNYNDEEPKE